VRWCAALGTGFGRRESSGADTEVRAPVGILVDPDDGVFWVESSGDRLKIYPTNTEVRATWCRPPGLHVSTQVTRGSRRCALATPGYRRVPLQGTCAIGVVRDGGSRAGMGRFHQPADAGPFAWVVVGMDSGAGCAGIGFPFGERARWGGVRPWGRGFEEERPAVTDWKSIPRMRRSARATWCGPPGLHVSTQVTGGSRRCALATPG